MFVKYNCKLFPLHIFSYSVLTLVNEKYTSLSLIRTSDNMLHHANMKESVAGVGGGDPRHDSCCYLRGQEQSSDNVSAYKPKVLYFIKDKIKSLNTYNYHKIINTLDTLVSTE